MGGQWPCNEGKAPLGSVIVLSAEDGAADTIVPRLHAAGADLGRVQIVSAVRERDGKGRRARATNELSGGWGACRGLPWIRIYGLPRYGRYDFTGVQPWVGVLLLEEERLRSLHRWECAKLTDRKSRVQLAHLSCSNRRDCLGFRMRCDLGKLAHYRDRGKFLGSLIWIAERWPFGCRDRNLRTVKANSSRA